MLIGHSSLCPILAAMTATRRTVQGFREKYRKPRRARKIFPRNPQGPALHQSERRVATFAGRIDTARLSLPGLSAILLRNQMLQFGVVLYALHLVGDYPLDIVLYTGIVPVYLLLHDVVAVLVQKIIYYRDFPVGLRLGRHPRAVNDDSRVENLLVNLLAEVVGNAADEGSLRQVGDLGCRDKGIKLGVYRGGGVLPVDGYRLALLEDLAEAFRQAFCRLADDLPAEYVADSVLDNLRLLVAVVARKLGEVLEAETYRHLVGARRCYKVVDAAKIYGREFVNDNGTFELSFLVYKFDYAAVVKSECCRIYVLPVRIVAHAEDFRGLRVIEVKCEIVACHDPVQLG